MCRDKCGNRARARTTRAHVVRAVPYLEQSANLAGKTQLVCWTCSEPAGKGLINDFAETEGSSHAAQSARSRMTICRSWYGAMSGPGSIVSIVKASPASLLARQMPAMQNQGSPFLVKSHLSFRFFFWSVGPVNS